MPEIYTENRNLCHEISEVTEFRDREFNINSLLLKDFLVWHDLCSE